MFGRYINDGRGEGCARYSGSRVLLAGGRPIYVCSRMGVLCEVNLCLSHCRIQRVLVLIKQIESFDCAHVSWSGPETPCT